MFQSDCIQVNIFVLQLNMRLRYLEGNSLPDLSIHRQPYRLRYFLNALLSEFGSIESHLVE